jgi:uncharacterized protein (DUF3820 family)
VNTYGSPKYVVIYLEDIVYPGGYKGKVIADSPDTYLVLRYLRGEAASKRKSLSSWTQYLWSSRPS